ncbi:hypothetical protein Tsubulata_032867 [Turnera subulata]|uniref:Clp R domain-containing protein n=1 Tax=Turnera subulata TaxID=218843 RepID=A0A9Q0GBS6_9ROSI|nr:hypothetical protein Tsubulata_032867 [Turnera subulata]
MRSGACTVQQTLTAEAASVLKHSLGLARRRGHAQVTPLHVAATLLSSRTSLLRRACLKSQPHHHHQQLQYTTSSSSSSPSHPLQCRALELCFNVALNRLPTHPGPMLHGQPTLSNALIAALKRAQAHQRRGCIEQQQQQPLLTIKVELEQLVISILDDPSVSRVMREAGFSSTAVKNNLEDSSASAVFQGYTSSGGVFSSPCSPTPTHETQRDHHQIINPATFWQTHFFSSSSTTPDHQQNQVLFSPQKKVPRSLFADLASVKDDIKLVLEVFLRKKRKNTVIVGDCVPITEGLINELMGRVERGDVPVELKQTRFIKFQFAPVSLRFMKKDDVEMNLSELKKKVDSLGEGGGAIIYAGDLKWTIEETVFIGDASGYSAADHLVTELGRLLSQYSTSNTKVWLMATASYQTYMRCQTRKPPLEIQWALQAVSVPSGGLDLSLHASSIYDSSINFSQNPSQVLETKPLMGLSKDEQDKFPCCPECLSNFEKEAQSFKSGHQKHLPSWLQPQGTENQQKDELEELRRKWNRLCFSLRHQGRHVQSYLGIPFYNSQGLTGKGSAHASTNPWGQSQSSNFPDSNSISFVDSTWKVHQSSNYLPKFKRQQSCTIEFNFVSGIQKHHPEEPSLDVLKNTEGQEVKISLALGNSLCSDSGKSEKGRTNDLSKLLKENVPWQSEIIPSIAEALNESKTAGRVSWLLIQGNDTVGKRRLALAIAESVLGSADLLFQMNMRSINNEMNQHTQRLERALRNQDKMVVLVEAVDLADTKFLKFLGEGFENGNFGGSENRERKLDQAVFILTKSGGSIVSEDNGKTSPDSVVHMTLKVTKTKAASSGTENMSCKRKSEWETSNKAKSSRIKDKDDVSCVPTESKSKQKDLSRQSSFNSLDLNIKADEESEREETPGELSPISSDLTRDTTSDPTTPQGFLDVIKNRFVFDQDHQSRDRQMADVFLSKLNSCFQEVFGDQNEIGFSSEERVLEEIVEGLGSVVNSLFDKWLKDIFQTTLQTVKFGGKEGIGFMLCFGGKSDKVLEDGFMGTYLPKKIPVSFMD